MGLEERFSKKWEPVTESGCWIWTGYCAPTGYGFIHYKGMPTGAHRASWIIANGEIPEGMDVCHKCDTRCCVNPSHLFIGTASDNLKDCVAKGRHRGPSGETHPLAKLSDSDVVEIRQSNEPETILASRYGVHPYHVRKVKRMESRKKVSGNGV